MKPAKEAETWPEKRKRAWTRCAKGGRATGEGVSRTQTTDQVRGLTVSAGMARRSSLVTSVQGNSGGRNQIGVALKIASFFKWSGRREKPGC